MSHSADVLVPMAKADNLMKAAKLLATHLAMYGAPAPVFASVTEVLLNLFHSGFKMPPDNDTSPASPSGSSSAAASPAPTESSAAAARAFFRNNPVKGQLQLSEDSTSRKPLEEQPPRRHRRPILFPVTPPKSGSRRTAVKTTRKPEPLTSTAKHGAFSRRNYLLRRGATSAQDPRATRCEGDGVISLRRPLPPPPPLPKKQRRPSSQLRR